MDNVNIGHSRTVDEVQKTLELAGIKESDLCNVTQVLYSAKEHDIEKRIKLLELDDHLLDIITKGESLSFQGDKHESAVLCTKSRTYDIREAETSNSCLLIPSLITLNSTDASTSERTMKQHNISGIFHTYHEVRPSKPRLEKLLNVLEATSFKGIEYESSIDQELLYNWHRLRNEIQASEDELSKALDDYLITNIDGYYRLISFEAEVRCLTMMLDLFDENSWELDKVDKEVTYASLKEFIPKPVFEVLFRKYTETSDKIKTDGTQLYRYNEEQCCKSLARVLLAASSVTEYKQFMESWRIGTPEKMVPKEGYLNGIALVISNNSTMKKEVIAFPETDLPRDINERFHELYKAKDKWTVNEITPYLKNLTTSQMNVNALLTKYARCSVINGVKYYSAKHGK